MKLDAKEKLIVDNLLKMIRRIKLDGFVGEEALALSTSYHWLASLLKPEPPAPPAPPEVVSDKVVDMKGSKKK